MRPKLPHHLSLSRPTHSGLRQRGGAAVMMMLLLLGLVTILGLVEVGFLYWVKRDVQKTADLAALAGAQRLELCRADNGDNTAARQNALTDNAFSGTVQIECGHWSPTLPQDARFIAPTATQLLNAVRVTTSREAVPLFGQLPSMPRVHATATARRAAPQAAFSVGSRLLNVNSAAPLQGLLRVVGLDLSGTEIASYRGLANVKITPRGLLEALGIGVATDITVGDLNSLLAANSIEVGQLLDLMATLVSQQGVADVNLGVLRSLLASANLDRAEIRLGSANGSGGLFASIVAGDSSPNSALDINLNALDLLGTSISIANSQHAVDIPSLNLLGLVQAKASIVEPASIAIGPVGTTAYNSQVRLFLDIDSQNIPALGAVFSWLGTRIKLPIYVDVIDGFGRLTAIDCSAQPATATVDVTSSIANICIGKAITPWDSTREMCSTGLGNENLITLLGTTVLEHRISLPALQGREDLTLSAGQIGTVAPNQLEIGTLISDLVSTLLGTLGSLFTPSGNASEAAFQLATGYLDATATSGGRYQPAAVVAALKNGHGELPAIGTWTTAIPGCQMLLVVCIPITQQGDVWLGFQRETGISDASLIGGLLDVLGITACDGLLTQLLNYNNCIRNSLAKYLQTKPGGVEGGNYNPVTGSGSCSGLVCILLKPIVDGLLRPLLNSVGNLLSSTLSNVLGLELGRSDVHMQSIQCGNAQLVD